MKLKSLHIDSYRHLENLDFDFTYPEGHSKFGQPLEKICIIGQSATGKTSVLELVKDVVSQISTIEILNGTHLFKHHQLSFKGNCEFLYNDENVKISDNSINKNGKEFVNLASGGGSIGHLFDDDLKLLYLSSEIITKESINILNQNPLNLLDETAKEKFNQLNTKYNSHSYIYEFTQNTNEELWFYLLYKILEYRKRFSQMASELLSKGTIGDLNKLHREFEKWSESNKNPLISFANYFNPLLKRLNLEIDLINTEYSIPIKAKKKDEIVPISSISTGTKGLLISMFLVYEIETFNGIILLDEPERSLFPDMQIDLITHYQKAAPTAQFIVATHSPFIAAAFEPEERFILYFDKEGKVAVRRGESPIGDDPNDILRNDFNVDYYNEFGKNAYKAYLDLKRKVMQETESEKKKELLVELTELGDKYNF